MEPEYNSAYCLKQWDTVKESKKLEVCLHILKKPFEVRSEDDLALLYKFTEQIQFFKDIGPKVHKECCSYLTYCFAETDKVIMKEGDYGTKFYIIIQGSVGAYRWAQKAEHDQDDKSCSSQYNSLIKLDEEPTKSVHQSLNHLAVHASIKEKTNNNNAIQNTIQTLQFVIPGKESKENKVLEEQSVFQAGDTFGQRALFHNGRRKATIIAKEPTYFACIEKHHFDLTLKEREENAHTENINFFQNLNYFKSFSYHTLEQVYYLAKKLKFTKNQPVYSQGGSPDSVYIIKEGQFKVMKSIAIKDEFGMTSASLEIPQKGLLRRKSVQRNGEIAIFSQGELFGEYEITKNIPREDSVICDSREGELYVLSKYAFFTKLYSDKQFRVFIDQHRLFRTQVYKERLDMMENITTKNKNLLVYVNTSHKKRSPQPTPSPSRSFDEEKPEKEEKSLISSSQPKFQEYPNYPEYPSKRTPKISSRQIDTNSQAEKIKGILLKIPNLDNRIKSQNSSPEFKTRSYNVFSTSTKAIPGSKVLDKDKKSLGLEKISSQDLTKDISKNNINTETNGSMTCITPKEQKRRKSRFSIKIEPEDHRTSPSLFTASNTKRKGTKALTIATYSALPAVNSLSLSPRLNTAGLDQPLDQNYLLTNYRSSIKLPLTPNGSNLNPNENHYKNGILVGNGNAFEPRRKSLFGTNPNTQYKTNNEYELTRQPSIILHAPQTPSTSHHNDARSGKIDDNLTPRLLVKTMSPSKFVKIPPGNFSMNTSPREKVKMVIQPLKKQQFLFEAKKVEAFMQLKLTGRIKI